MPLMDATDDLRGQMQLASNIGNSIAGIINTSNQKKQLADQREKRTLQQAYTTKLLNSDLQGQDLLNAFNQMPGAVDNDLVQSMNQKALQNRVSGQPNQSTQALGKLMADYRKFFQWDGVQQEFIAVPGSETLRQGYLKGIKNTMEKINAESEAEKTRMQPTGPPEQTEIAPVTEAPSVAGEISETDIPSGSLRERINAIKDGPGSMIQKRAKMVEATKAFKNEKISAKSVEDEPTKPTAEELKAQNTREAYEIGKKLGYWK